MKLLTINTHSLLEKNYNEKCGIFADAIRKLSPDIIAMQEVNQSISLPVYTPASPLICLNPSVALKKDNHALNVMEKLGAYGIKYYGVWLAVKKGYGIYDEGLAFLSKIPPDKAYAINISRTNDYENWKTRQALVICCGSKRFCNVHMGWWYDGEEPFFSQWHKLINKLDILKNEEVYLMGDFNSPADENDTGYCLVTSSGWHDTYKLAAVKDDGYTISANIDGWKEYSPSKKRIDYIFSNRRIKVKSSFTVFDGKNEKQISDHFGVMVTI